MRCLRIKKGSLVTKTFFAAAMSSERTQSLPKTLTVSEVENSLWYSAGSTMVFNFPELFFKTTKHSIRWHIAVASYWKTMLYSFESSG